MKILVCIDGSEATGTVLSGLAANVWSAKTEWMVITVVVPSFVDVLDDALPFEAHSAHDRQELLDHAVERIRAMNAGRVVGAHVALGNPGKEILAAASGWKCDLIVIGTSDSTSLSKLFLGSASSHLLKNSSCPVMAFRNDSSFRNVCVAMDGSATDLSVLSWIDAQPWRADTRFHFLTVIPPISAEKANDSDVDIGVSTLQQFACAEDRALETLHKEISRSSKLSHLECNVEVVDGATCEKILEYSSFVEADLLLLGSHNRGFFARLLTPSVSLQTALNSACSIAVVKHGPFIAEQHEEDLRLTENEDLRMPRVPMSHL